jgi:type I restriction enzyme S subunit
MGPFGSNITKDNFIDHGVPVIRGNNLTEFRFLDRDFVFVNESKAERLKASEAKRQDIVVTHRGTLGQVAIIPSDSRYQKYIVSQSGMKLTCDTSRVNPYFVFYFLKSPAGQYLLLKNTSQTGVPAIAQPLSSLKQVPIPLPQLPEQNAIVNLFSSLDDKIELNQQMNNTLEKIGQALFKHWFGNFEFPDEKGKPYKSSGGEMVDSELGKIPKGWRIATLREYITIERGLSYKGSGLTDYGLPMINLANIAPNHGFIYAGIKPYSGEYKERNIVRVGDIVIANTDITQKRDVLGSPAIVPDLGSEKILFTHHIYAVRNKSWIPNIFIYYLLQLKEYENRTRGFATGTTVLFLPEDAILDFQLALPNKELVENFVSIIQKHIDKSEINNSESQRLSQLRNSLLPKLMSGKIRVNMEAS